MVLVSKVTIVLEDAEEEDFVSITFEGDPDLEEVAVKDLTPAQKTGLQATHFIVNVLLGDPSD